MGIAISPRGDMPKYRVPFSQEDARMSSYTSISVDKLARLIGTAKAPVLIDVRTQEDFAADPRLIPGAARRSHDAIEEWSRSLSGKPAVVVCHKGKKLSEGVAAWLRHSGISAEVLEGGFQAWESSKLPLVPTAILPPRDPDAVFLFVTASEVPAVAERFGATPFDIEDVFWSHRGELCTFDVMIDEFRLAMPPLLCLGQMVRAADTGRLDLSPEAPGLLAASLGLSRMYDDDLEQLEAGIALYDAFYRWCRDATGEAHNWPTNKAKAQP
jgi:rhodanese-related sulfurtransferase